MITREQFHTIATAEGLHNPRASRYLVTPLSQGPEPYGFRHAGQYVPAIVMQFAVENLYEEAIKRVISIAYYEGGFALWCGDKFTQGDIEPRAAGASIAEVVRQVPAAYAHRVRNALMTKYGSYRHRAPCHFWKAWHDHQGLCKHVAAALQYVHLYRSGGIDQLLTDLESAHQVLMTAPPAFLAQAADTTVELPRYKLPMLPPVVAQMLGTDTDDDIPCVLWLKNGHTISGRWDAMAEQFVDESGRPLAIVFIQAWTPALAQLARPATAG